MDDLGTLLSVNNWPGNLSYLLIAISYWLTNMFWIRSLLCGYAARPGNSVIAVVTLPKRLPRF